MSERSEKFKVGDKVIRTTDSNAYVVVVGKSYTVVYAENGVLRLEGVPHAYDANCFKLYEEKPQMQNMKFDVAKIAKELGVGHQKASALIQEMLFEQGVEWGNFLSCVGYTEAGFLFLRDGLITKGDDEYYFYNQCPLKEFTIKQTYSFVETSEIETVELNGKKYNKQELEKALSMLKPIEN